MHMMKEWSRRVSEHILGILGMFSIVYTSAIIEAIYKLRISNEITIENMLLHSQNTITTFTLMSWRVVILLKILQFSSKVVRIIWAKSTPNFTLDKTTSLIGIDREQTDDIDHVLNIAKNRGIFLIFLGSIITYIIAHLGIYMNPDTVAYLDRSSFASESLNQVISIGSQLPIIKHLEGELTRTPIIYPNERVTVFILVSIFTLGQWNIYFLFKNKLNTLMQYTSEIINVCIGEKSWRNYNISSVVAGLINTTAIIIGLFGLTAYILDSLVS